MEFKKNAFILLLSLSYNALSSETNTAETITVISAWLEDLDAIKEISHSLYQDQFQPIWESYHGKSSFVEEKMRATDTEYKKIIKNPTLYIDEKLLVAELLSDQHKKIVGICRLNKEPQKIYVKFLAIHKDFRQQGIATHFINIISNKFNDVTTYEFRTLKDNQLSNDLFIKYGCVKTGESTLDPKTGKISTDTNLPMIYNNYSYQVKK